MARFKFLPEKLIPRLLAGSERPFGGLVQSKALQSFDSPSTGAHPFLTAEGAERERVDPVS